MPYLVFDGLGRHALPSAARLRRIIRAILERNYAAVCPPDYVEKVVASVKPDRYRLRAPRYLKSEQIAAPLPGAAGQVKIALVVNDKHDIHHVHRSEEHTSELQSLMRISYAVFCLKKKKSYINNMTDHDTTINPNT